VQITPEQWPDLSRLLDAALELEPEARERWLARLPPPAATLGPALRALLACHARAETGDFLNALPRLGPLPGTGPEAPAEDDGAAGTVVGPYVIEAEIGRGGMGIVWRARRHDGLLKRPVALKLPRMAVRDPDLLARFARERDILAALEHPHIARLYDAGTTADGQVYLALEYVEGDTLTAYADRHRLDLAARLALFRQVLGAVQYAHRHLTIHRDLKPSNILVTADGGVRLLDFGVAKLLPAEGGGDGAMTEFGAHPLTPQYAAPEQLQGGPITTATDVYALGVVLYELLTGGRPYPRAAQSRAALEGAIVDAEPRRPSAAIEADAQAQARGTGVAGLRRALKGDLDTIVLKALKQAPEERFATVDAFAADIDNFLHGRPVLARPDSVRYRATKFLRRNTLLVGALAAVIVALAAGLSIALWQSHEARRHALLAEREARKAQAVQAFLLDLFQSNSDAQADPVTARERTARELLDAGADKVERSLGAVPEVEAAVLVTLVDMYAALGLDERAAQLQLRRIEILRRLLGPDDPAVADETLAYAESIDALRGSRQALEPLAAARRILAARPDASPVIRARLLRDTARVELKLAPADALRSAEIAVEFYRRELPGAEGYGAALGYLARARFWLGDLVGAGAAYREDIADARRREPEALGELITALLGSADVELALGHIAEAEAQLRTALDESTRRNGEWHVDTVHAETRLGALLHATGRRAEGRRLLEDAAAKTGRGGELGSANLIGPVQRNLGMALLADGRWQDAARPLAENLALKRRLAVGGLLAGALDDMAVLDSLTGRYAAAHALLEEATATWAEVAAGKADPARANRYRLHAGQLLLAEGEPAAAAARFAEVVPPRDAAAMPLDADRVAADAGRARAALELGELDAAFGAATAARERLERAPTRGYWTALEADVLLVLGRIETRRGEHAAARAHLERALALRTAAEDPHSPWLAEVEAAVAAAALARGERGAARVHARRAAAIAARHAELGAQFRAPIRAVAAALAAGGAVAASR
jgi:eukaryotic-like serine/threonine-protein kinase